MTTTCIGSLTVFDHNSQEWKIFHGRLQQYILLNSVEDAKKAPLLLTHLSDETYRLATDLVHPKKVEEVAYDALVAVLNKHFSPKRCTFADREKFFEARRTTGESVEGWAARVRGLAVHCEFGSALDKLLVDRFVLGMNVGRERDRLFEQDATSLSFAKALEVAQQAASARHARATATESTAAALVKEEPVYRVSGTKPATDRGREVRKCTVCGMKNHDAEQCKYKGYKCQKCGLVGHLKKVCKGKLSRINNIVQQNSDTSDEASCCVECQNYRLRFQD
ncbi:uncharacterized protein LOC134654528 [Cydia amplana]|uniref:uncharacterized protein LOC134654528 n=1 Tax=Cydia amplana TaxID=1869771 RepID=UPI002FE6A3B2